MQLKLLTGVFYVFYVARETGVKVYKKIIHFYEHSMKHFFYFQYLDNSTFS